MTSVAGQIKSGSYPGAIGALKRAASHTCFLSASFVAKEAWLLAPHLEKRSAQQLSSPAICTIVYSKWESKIPSAEPCCTPLC